MHVRQPRACVAVEAPRRDLREPETVVRLRAERRLDLRLGRRDRRARLAGVPGEPDLRLLREIDAALRRLLREEQRIGRRAAERGDRIGDERVDALLRREPPGGEHERAEVLRGVEA